MRVTSEMLDSLKQNDRIEFLLRDKIQKDNAPSFPISVSDIFFILFAPAILILLLMAALGEKAYPAITNLLNAWGIVLKVYIFVIVILLVFHIFSVINYYHKKKALFNKFFKVEAKK